MKYLKLLKLPDFEENKILRSRTSSSLEGEIDWVAVVSKKTNGTAPKTLVVVTATF